MTPRVAVLLLGSIACGHAWGVTPGRAQELRYSGALQYSTGSYVFETRTHSLYLSNGLLLSGGRVEWSAWLPLVLQNGGVVTWTGGQPVPTGGGGHGVVARRQGGRRIPTGRRRGAGDPLPTDSAIVFRDAYQLDVGDPTGRISLEVASGYGTLRALRVTGAFKAPLASLESGAGTGEWDATVGASLTTGFGRALLVAAVDYWWLGDLPDLPLGDGVAWGVSGGIPAFGGRGNLMASLSGSHRMVETMEPPLTLGVALGYGRDDGWSVSGGVAAGLSESTPDLSLFLGWSRGL